MRIIDCNNTIAEDGWQFIADDAELPAGDVIVSVKRWQAERDALNARSDRLALVLHPMLATGNSAVAAVDRLVHHAHIVDIQGESYRKSALQRRDASN